MSNLRFNQSSCETRDPRSGPTTCYAAYADTAGYSGSCDSPSNFVVCSVTLGGLTISAVSIRLALKTEAGTLCDGGNAEPRVGVPNCSVVGQRRAANYPASSFGARLPER